MKVLIKSMLLNLLSCPYDVTVVYMNGVKIITI